jgi:Tol biopolymer transport system component
LPVQPVAESLETGGMLRAAYGAGARLVVVNPDGALRVLTGDFHSACDPEVSFDGTRVLFAGKRAATDRWNVFEMAVNGSQVRQITRDTGNCRSPSYQSQSYLLDLPPWYQIMFVSDAAGTLNEASTGIATHLYTCKLDGSDLRRITYNLSSDLDPWLMEDGRVLYASWRRGSLERGPRGRWGLFGVDLDGANCALFAEDAGRRVKQMPCVTAAGWVVFIESDRLPWDGAGTLGVVRMRRPLHSYQPLTREDDGYYHSPAPLPDGRLLVSWRPADGTGTQGVVSFDPASGKREPVFDDPGFHDVQAKLLQTRTEADGRSTVVQTEDPHGKFYCLNVYVTDLKDRGGYAPGTVKHLRALQGVSPASGARLGPQPALATRRILGEAEVSADGSFHIEVPANTPLELQTLDADGLALRSCRWVWARNHSPQGCIGCHEDGEATPENIFAQSLGRAAEVLCPPLAQRRSVDFRRDVLPVLDRKCVSCHRADGSAPRLDDEPPAAGQPRGAGTYAALLVAESPGLDAEPQGKYVQPGSARRSPLVWHLLGRNTSRPWDGAAATRPVKPMPREKSPPLSEQDIRMFVEWIDLGAAWEAQVAREP